MDWCCVSAYLLFHGCTTGKCGAEDVGVVLQKSNLAPDQLKVTLDGFVCKNALVHACMHAHTFVCTTHTRMHTMRTHTHTHCARTHTHTQHTHTHTHTHCARTHTHTQHTHTHTHTHTQAVELEDILTIWTGKSPVWAQQQTLESSFMETAPFWNCSGHNFFGGGCYFILWEGR